jgi:hypothetical protein
MYPAASNNVRLRVRNASQISSGYTLLPLAGGVDNAWVIPESWIVVWAIIE